MTAETDIELLLAVVDRFQIDNLGLVLAPDFSVPGGNWSDQTHTVTVESPDGDHFNAEAVFGLSHFNIRDPEVPIDRRWRVTVTMPHTHKDQIPIGSKVFASRHLVAILRKKPAEQDGAGQPPTRPEFE